MTTTIVIPEAEVRAAIKAQPITSREPAVITGVLLGAAASVATAVAQAHTPEGLNWWSLIPALIIVAVSVAIRFGVVSPARAQAVQDELAKVAAQASAAAPALTLVLPQGFPADKLTGVLEQLGHAEVPDPDIAIDPQA